MARPSCRIRTKIFMTLNTLLPPLLASTSPLAAAPTPTPDSVRQASLAEWRDAKFGLFIHWGPVSLAGTEIGWSRGGERRGYWGEGTEVPQERYDNLYKQFNPVDYDPDEWVRIAKAAGMKYIVLTTRHHDGFSLWDTKANDYKITSEESPCGKDIVGPLAEAARKAGLKFGVYYSQPDWKNPDAFTENHQRYLDYLKLQLRELLTNYGRIDIVWFDGLGKSAEDYNAVEINGMIRELQPGILINDRNGLPEDFSTPEQRVGNMEVNRPWESCITICQQWAWKPGDKMKSLGECLRMLVTTVTGDGNLLLNIGPMPGGAIEPRQVERLREIGAWLNENGVAIYGTRGGPWRNGGWGGSTYRDKTIYVHLLNAPVAGRLQLAPLPHKILSAEFLRNGKPVAFQQGTDGVTLDLGANGFEGPVTIVNLTLDEPVTPGQILGNEAGPFADDMLYGKPHQADANVTVSSGEALKDELGRWGVKTEDAKMPSVNIDLGKPMDVTAVSAASVEHNAFNSNVDLHIAISEDGEKWEEVYKGSYGLPEWEVPVTRHVAGIQQPGRPARYVKLWIDYGAGLGRLTLGKLSIYAR